MKRKIINLKNKLFYFIMESLTTIIKDHYGLISLGILATYTVLKVGSNFLSKIKANLIHKKYLKFGQFAKDQRNKRIEAFYQKYKGEITKEDIVKITSLSAEQLLEHIKSKKITSRKATLCYALNAATVGKELENIADADFELALKEADEADKLIANSKNPKELPPLIGLPVTIKDHVPLKGYIDTIGYCSRYNNIADEDCEVVSALRSLGAIFICKSNVPQALLAAESSNNVWGKCQNIWDRTRTTGGSSGGEAGLISSFCSPIGIGTDIGGSIRIPSNFSGIYGFKPTANKICKKGILGTNCKQFGSWKTWTFSTGFLARKYEDIILFSRLLFGRFPENHLIDQRPFNDDLFNTNRKLKIGYFYNYSGFETHKDIANAIDSIVAKLKEKTDQKEFNYEVVEFNLNSFLNLYFSGYNLILNGEGFVSLWKAKEGEKEQYFYKDYELLLDADNCKLKFISAILKTFTNEERAVDNLGRLNIVKNLKDIWALNEDFYKLQDDFYQFTKKNGFDGFILPVFPIPAAKIGNAEITNNGFFYTLFTNMLDLPSVALPCGNIINTDYQTRFKDKLSKMTIDDIKDSKDLPIGIQVAALPGKDELCLRIARDVISVTKLNYNDLSINNKQTENFWQFRKLEN